MVLTDTHRYSRLLLHSLENGSPHCKMVSQVSCWQTFCSVLLTVAISLQLSTSINMPFNPYRPHRYPDSVNRSRFPVNAPQPGMRTMSSNPLPSNTWTTPIIQNVVYQNGYNPMPTPQSAFIPQKPRVPAIQTGKLARSVELESSYFQHCFTPDENHDQWSAGKRPRYVVGV